MKKNSSKIASLLLGLCLVSVCVLRAGDLNPAAAPDNSGSAMFTLEDLYQRLLNGTAGSKRSGGFVEPSTGPTAGTMHNVNDIMGKMPVKDDSNGATDSNVLQGKKFWGLTSVQWGITEGTIPDIGQQNITPTSAEQYISKGYHDGSGKVVGDANLVSDNIKAGVAIFGVSGKTEVVDTTSGDAVAGEVLAGKKAWVDGSEVIGAMTNVGAQNVTAGTTNVTITQGYHNGSGQVAGDADLVSGNIRAGVNLFGVTGNSNVVNTSTGDATNATIQFGKKAWVDGVEITGYLAGGAVCSPAATYSPQQRWCNNGNGTVTDTTTGLIWLDKGNQFWGTYASCSANISNLQNGLSGLTDGSSSFDWRMPTMKEMLNLTSGTEAISPANQYFFTGMQTGWYWTSSASTNPIPLKKMRVQMPYSSSSGVAENLGALYWSIAVRNP